jgi:hypothetical protein
MMLAVSRARKTVFLARERAREVFMMNRRTAWLAASAAIFLSSAPASAVEIVNTFIDEQGNLVLDIADDPPPVPLLTYHTRARASATYVCANPAGQPRLASRTVESVIEERASLTVGAGGGIHGLIMLTLPRERVNLACPRGFSPRIASVVYSQIEARNPFGQIGYARDDARVFIPLEF